MDKETELKYREIGIINVFRDSVAQLENFVKRDFPNYVDHVADKDIAILKEHVEAIEKHYKAFHTKQK